MRRLCLAALLLTAAPAFAQREFGFDNRKPSGQPYLTPEESVKRMKVAPEFEVKLFAGEPLVINPIAFTIDEKGRVWVVECFEYPSRTPPGKAPRDRIVILEDTDGDGICDKRTVFAEGKDFPVPAERKAKGLGAFDLASGIEVGHGGVYVGAPPYLWFIENKNDKPGKFETLLSGFGSQDTHETLNTFQWGPDGWLYGLHGVFTQSTVKPLDGPETRMNAAVWRFHPKTKKFEIYAEGTSNPWGLDWRNTDGQFILACCVIPHLYHIVPGGIYKRQAGTSYNPYAYGSINEICDHTFHRESGWAHAGLISLDAPHIPEKYRNSVIFGSIHGCSVKQNILKPNGSSFTASRGDDFLVSGDKNVRPINMKWGPLGDIYLIDWHDQNPCHQAEAGSWDYERGRVYRIQLKGTKAKKAEDLSTLDISDLTRKLSSDDPYTYRTALRLIHEREQKDKPLVRKLDSMPRSRQIWAENAFGRFGKDVVQTTGPGPTPEQIKSLPADFRWLVRVVAESGHATPRTLEQFAAIALGSPQSQIRLELSSAAIRLAEKQDVSPLLHALMAHTEDANDPLIPHLVWYAYERSLARGADANELAWLAKEAPGNPFVRDQIVPKVMRRLVATGEPSHLALCLKFVADVTDAAAREKALAGLALALDGQMVDAPTGWAALQPQLRTDPKLAPLANKLAVSFRDPAALKRAYEVVHDAGQPSDARAEALRQVVLLRHPDAYTLVASLMRQETEPRVRAEAARQLAAFSEPRIGADTVRDWRMFPPAIRPDVVNSLASRKEWAKALLLALKDKKIDRTAVTDNTIIRIQAFKDAELNKLIETAWGRTRPTPKELDALIAKMRGEMNSPGSFARGKLVFEAQCAKCHKFDGKGSDVGPPLDGAARDVEYILANVIDPNRVIGAPYFQRIAKTADGRVEQGLLAEEDDKFITLKVESGVLKKLAKADLDGPVTVLEKSMMPEGLTAGISTQDFRDLVRYLMANPFLIEVTVNGERVSAGVTGRIPLPDRVDLEPSTVAAEVTAPAEVRTQLLVGAYREFEVKLDGKVIGRGTGTPGGAAPDREAVAVTLPPGTHTLTVTTPHKGTGQGVYLRFLDPDRKLRYSDPGPKE